MSAWNDARNSDFKLAFAAGLQHKEVYQGLQSVVMREHGRMIRACKCEELLKCYHVIIDYQNDRGGALERYRGSGISIACTELT